MTGIVRVGADDLDEVASFLAREQSHPARNIAYVGVEREGIAAELADLETDWAIAAHAVRADDGTLAGLAYADWDVDLGRVWLHGPWVAGEDDQWDQWAGPLFDAVLAATPGMRDIELSATIENERLGAFAQARGFERSEPNYVLALPLDGERPAPVDAEIVDAGPEDVERITPLHESEFPATYASPRQLLDGNYVLLVADGGYAAGRVTPDGEGYIDFVAVEETARGAGLGRRLVIALVARLAAAGARKQVCLTVQEHRAGARRLYEALGFEAEIVIVGYRKKD